MRSTLNDFTAHGYEQEGLFQELHAAAPLGSWLRYVLRGGGEATAGDVQAASKL